MDAGIQYVYDAEGRRVGKTDGTVYVVGLSGNVIDELDNGIWRRSEVDAGGKHIATETQTGTYFTHVDWLGTERGRTSPTGTLCQQTTSFSFGDGAVSSTPAGVAGCNPSPGFFTGKERDPESSLDDFGARYYSSQWGRWMSPDWSASPSAVPYSTMANPQSLNLYAYVGNDPINGEDADGHSIWRQGGREDWYNGGNSEASNNPSHGGYGSLLPPPPNFHRGVSSTLIVDDTSEGSGAFYSNALQAQQQNSTSSTSTTGTTAQDHYVSIGYWPTGAGGFGHIGVQVDSDDTQEYSTEDPSVHWWQRLFGAPAARTEDDIAQHTTNGDTATHFYHHISITADQATGMQGAMAARTKNPGHYNLLFNNCAGFVESVLRSGGVWTPHAEIFGPPVLYGILSLDH